MSSMKRSTAEDAARPGSIDEYIAGFSVEVQAVLQGMRATIAAAAPGARELISYRMPAFAQDGILLYFAAFKSHIGVFPPVSGDARLEKALAPYRGPKGNLRFPLDRPIPYELIRRIATLRVKQNLAKAATKRPARKAAPRSAARKVASKTTDRKTARG
jgi:uncharacterized protein YdhG (YjbR/CyaY superfamily)